MFEVVFKGFKTIEQAKEFVTWYSEQGEQDSDYFLTENGGFSAYMDCSKTEVLEDKVIAHLNIEHGDTNFK